MLICKNSLPMHKDYLEIKRAKYEQRVRRGNFKLFNMKNRHYILGGMAIVFYLAHSITWIYKESPANMLWACHLACLLIGIAAFVCSATLNAVGVLWLILGNVLWFIYLSTTGDFIFTSFLTHIGGLLLGLLMTKKVGFPSFSWLKAFLLFPVLQLFTYFITPEKENINLAFRIQDGWGSYFKSYWLYLLFLYFLALVSFVTSEFLIKKIIK